VSDPATQRRTWVTEDAGMKMIVASEAPVSDIFPYSALFFAHFLSTLEKLNEVEFLPEGLAGPVLDYVMIFGRASQSCPQGALPSCEFRP
jgi:hypothetical protein